MTACGPGCAHCGRCSAAWEYTDERAASIWCDWCEKYIWVGKEVLANHGGHFCSDECAANWAEDYAAYREAVHD